MSLRWATPQRGASSQLSEQLFYWQRAMQTDVSRCHCIKYDFLKTWNFLHPEMWTKSQRKPGRGVNATISYSKNFVQLYPLSIIRNYDRACRIGARRSWKIMYGSHSMSWIESAWVVEQALKKWDSDSQDQITVSIRSRQYPAVKQIYRNTAQIPVLHNPSQSEKESEIANVSLVLGSYDVKVRPRKWAPISH
jgi:hypothetical protein